MFRFWLLIIFFLMVQCADNDSSTEPIPEEPTGTFFFEAREKVRSFGLADFNGDQLTDLVVSHEEGPIRIFLNDGTASAINNVRAYDLEDEESPYKNPWLCVIDFNNDQRADLATFSPSGPGEEVPILCLLNNSEGKPRFTHHQTLDTPGWGNGNMQVYSLDINGDGTQDLIASHTYNTGGVWDAGFSVFGYRNSAGNLQQATYLGGQSTFISDLKKLLFRDLDQDGHQDLVAVRGGNEPGIFPQAFYGKSGFGFQPLTPLFESRPNCLYLQLEDVNADGLSDAVLITGQYSNDSRHEVLLKLGTQDGSFDQGLVLFPHTFPMEYSNLYLVDINHDQKPDLWLKTNETWVVVLNDGSSQPFIEGARKEITLDGSIYEMKFVDINHDTKDDLIYAHRNGGYGLVLNEALNALLQ